MRKGHFNGNSKKHWPRKEAQERSFLGRGNSLCKDLEARNIMLYLRQEQLEYRVRQWEEQEKE